MRTRLGLATLAVGVLLAALGAVVTTLLGPDGRYVTGPHEVRTDSLVVTRPAVLAWRGLELDVLAELPADKPVFVGLGNAVDVEDYVGRTRRVVVDGVGRPWDPSFEQVDGEPNLDASPVSLDWWLAAEAGLGAAHLSTTLPDETVEVAILPVGEADLTGLRVSVAYGVPHGFAWSLGSLLLGLGLAVLGVLLWRGVPLRPEPALVWLDDEEDEQRADAAVVPADADAQDDADPVEEQVVYVLVDEDGTEREISVEEAAAAGYEVVEEVVVEDPATPEGDRR